MASSPTTISGSANLWRVAPEEATSHMLHIVTWRCPRPLVRAAPFYVSTPVPGANRQKDDPLPQAYKVPRHNNPSYRLLLHKNHPEPPHMVPNTKRSSFRGLLGIHSPGYMGLRNNPPSPDCQFPFANTPIL